MVAHKPMMADQTETPIAREQKGKKQKGKKKMLKIEIDAQKFNFLNRFASNEQTRYNLNGVFFAKNGDVVATDGHRLGKFKDGYKLAEGSDPIDNGGLVVLTKRNKIVEKTVKNMTGMLTITAEQEKDGMYKNLTITDENGQSIKTDSIEWGNYPEYEKVIPQSKEKTESNRISFNTKYMADFSGYDKNDRGVQIEIHAESEPMLIFKPSLPDFLGVLMPMRL